MNPPIVPSDNLYRFLFFSGIIIVLFSLTISSKSYKVVDNYLTEVRGELKKLIKSKEFVLSGITKLNTELKELNRKQVELIAHNGSKVLLKEYKESERILQDKLDEFWMLAFENDLKGIDIEMKNELIERKRGDQKREEWEFWLLFIIGSSLVLIGLRKWMISQRYMDAILYQDYRKSLKSSDFCQSCGMILKFDTKPLENKDYCSFCYSSSGFNHANIILKDFKLIVKQRLIELKFSNKDINNHLDAMSYLDRWQHVFKWN